MNLNELRKRLDELSLRNGLEDATIEVAHVSPSLTVKRGQAVSYKPIHSITLREYRGKTKIEIVVIGKV